MALKTDVLSLPEYASRFQTIVSEVTLDGTDRQLILKPNSQRWYVRFEAGQGAGQRAVIPYSTDVDVNASLEQNTPKEYKYLDCPGVTTGGFLAWGMLGNTIVITEDIFQG